MTIAPVIDLPETAIAEICRLHEVKELSLFGSAARGEMRAYSMRRDDQRLSDILEALE